MTDTRTETVPERVMKAAVRLTHKQEARIAALLAERDALVADMARLKDSETEHLNRAEALAEALRDTAALAQGLVRLAGLSDSVCLWIAGARRTIGGALDNADTTLASFARVRQDARNAPEGHHGPSEPASAAVAPNSGGA